MCRIFNPRASASRPTQFGFIYQLTCEFQISIEGCLAKAAYVPIRRNLLMWLHLRGFIWPLYVPRQQFTGSLNGQGHLVASIMSDCPGLVVQNCSLRLLYKQDVNEFKQTIVQCFTSLFDNVDVIQQIVEDDSSWYKNLSSDHNQLLVKIAS